MARRALIPADLEVRRACPGYFPAIRADRCANPAVWSESWVKNRGALMNYPAAQKAPFDSVAMGAAQVSIPARAE